MQMMYEVRCYGPYDKDKPDRMCYASWLYKEDDANSIASEPCIFCGHTAWSVGETTLTVKDYFARMLKDQTGTIGYHVVQRDRTLEVQAPLD